MTQIRDDEVNVPSESEPAKANSTNPPSDTLSRSKPRIFTTFLVVILAFCGSLMMSGCIRHTCQYELYIRSVQATISKNPDPSSNIPLSDEELDAVFQKFIIEPETLAIMILPRQFNLIFFSVLAAYLSQTQFRQRLRLKGGRGSWLMWIPLVLAPYTLNGLITVVCYAFDIEASQHLAAISNVMRNVQGGTILWLLFLICVMPGIGEELFFRGYLQSRLEKRWPAWLAIFVSSILFSLWHRDPMHIVLTIPPGIWSGIIAYRTNSMLPPMLAHMISNLIAFILSRRSHNLASIDPDYFFLFDPVRIVIFCISLASFAISIVLLVRGRWDETSTETECKPIEAEAPKT